MSADPLAECGGARSCTAAPDDGGSCIGKPDDRGRSGPIPGRAPLLVDARRIRRCCSTAERGDAAGNRYPGGKNGAGVYQRIINLIPPHRVYIEPFGGSGAILLRKRWARSSIVVDVDGDVARSLASRTAAMTAAGACTVVNGDGIHVLREYAWRGDEFVYCDPPYVASTRRGGRVYRHELTDDQHLELLSLLVTIPAGVMVSGYRSALYDRELAHWRRVDFTAMTRGGPAVESLWMNYGEPALLHDDRYLGEDFRERERIARKRARWAKRFAALPRLERAAIFNDLRESMRA